jgi:hypothetical protein
VIMLMAAVPESADTQAIVGGPLVWTRAVAAIMVRVARSVRGYSGLPMIDHVDFDDVDQTSWVARQVAD